MSDYGIYWPFLTPLPTKLSQRKYFSADSHFLDRVHEVPGAHAFPFRAKRLRYYGGAHRRAPPGPILKAVSIIYLRGFLKVEGRIFSPAAENAEVSGNTKIQAPRIRRGDT